MGKVNVCFFLFFKFANLWELRSSSYSVETDWLACFMFSWWILNFDRNFYNSHTHSQKKEKKLFDAFWIFIRFAVVCMVELVAKSMSVPPDISSFLSIIGCRFCNLFLFGSNRTIIQLFSQLRFLWSFSKIYVAALEIRLPRLLVIMDWMCVWCEIVVVKFSVILRISTSGGILSRRLVRVSSPSRRLMQHTNQIF